MVPTAAKGLRIQVHVNVAINTITATTSSSDSTSSIPLWRQFLRQSFFFLCWVGDSCTVKSTTSTFPSRRRLRHGTVDGCGWTICRRGLPTAAAHLDHWGHASSRLQRRRTARNRCHSEARYGRSISTYTCKSLHWLYVWL